MSKNTVNEKAFSRYPDFGKFTIQLIEHALTPLLGKDVIETIRKPSENRRLYDKLSEALIDTEKEFISQHQGENVAEGLVQLPVATLPTIKDAFWHYVENPADTRFPRLIFAQLTNDHPSIEKKELYTAVDSYIEILKEKIINIDDEVRKKMSAAVLLSIGRRVESIDGKLDELRELRPMREVMERIEEILSSPSSPLPSQNLVVAAETTIPNKPFTPNLKTPSKSEKYSKPNETLRDILERLDSVQVQEILSIVENWVPPIIEKYLSTDYLDRPYAEMCHHIIADMAPYWDGHYNRYAPPSKIRDDRRNLFERMMKLAEPLPAFPNTRGIYLRNLSENFPTQIEHNGEGGFFLVDGEKHVRSLIDEGRISRFYVVYIARRNLNGWKKLTKESYSEYYRKPKRVALKKIKNIGKASDLIFHKLKFKDKELCLRGYDLEELGYPGVYSIELGFEYFDLFLTNFLEDIFITVSEMLDAENENTSHITQQIDRYKNTR